MITLNDKLRYVRPSTAEEIAVSTGLSAIVFLAFVASLVMPVPNVLKVKAAYKSRERWPRLPISFMLLFKIVLIDILKPAL